MYKSKLARMQLLISALLSVGCTVAALGGILTVLHASHPVAIERGGA